MDFTSFEPEDFLMETSFQGYCNGESETDTLFWDSWIAQHPEKLAVINEAKRLFAILHGHKGNLQEEIGKFKSLFATHIEVTAEKDANEYAATERWYVDNKGRFRRRILRIAGVAAICLILIGGIWFFKVSTPNAVIPHTVEANPIAYTTYSADFGTRKKITLGDGSVVILNSNSNIQVPDDFNQGDRQVLLDGAAFFEVVHNPQKPFTVHAKNLATVDIGTSFLVRAYDYEADIKVLLLSGKVSVQINSNNNAKITSHNIIELNPGGKLTLNKSTEQLQTAKFDVSSLESWKTGKLNFSNASFNEVIEELQSWYGVELKVEGNQRKPRHFTGQFDNENLDSVLKVISFSMDCHFKIEGNKVVIRFK